MNKQRRREIEFLKYKKRIKRFAASCSTYVARNGDKLYNPKAIDLIKRREQLIYKTTATPCSCEMCSGMYKYKRYLKKREDRRIMKDHENF